MCVQTTHGVEVEVGSWLCGFSVYIDSLMAVLLFAINIFKYLSPLSVECSFSIFRK
jgi:hypothetical protein